MTHDKRLTKGRKVRGDIYAFVRGFKKLNGGKSPSVREIMAACDISSTSVAWYQLQKLKEQGAVYITGKGYSRSRIELPGELYVLPEPRDIV